LVSLNTFISGGNNHDGWLGGAVNGILVAVEANGTSNGTLYLDGGTNAVPTGAGLTAVTTLQGRGWDVQVNS